MRRAERAAGRLAARSVRVAPVVLSILVAVMVAAADSSARLGASLTALTSTPAIRALYGEAFDLTTTGGLYAWRYGAVFAAIISVWAVLAATRVTRGEEEAGRAEVLLAAPLRRRALAATDLGVVCAACAVVGVATSAALIAFGQPVAGGLLCGAATGLVGTVFAALGGVAAQLFGQRRRAAGVGGLAVGAAFLIRMGADGSSSWQWLRWASPFGWVEEVRAFGGDNAVALLPLLGATVVLFAVALWLVGYRDAGAGVFAGDDSAQPRTRLLGRPLAFAWRERIGSTFAWAAALVVWGAVLGSVTKSLVDFMASNQAFQQLSRSFGFTSLSTAAAFIATEDTLVAVAVSLYAIASVHQLWDDEETGRLEVVYSGQIARWRWLGATTAVTAVVAFVLVLTAGLSTWAVAAIGGAGLTFGQALVGVANILPLILLFLGLAILVHGARPGAGAALGGGAVLAAYLLSFLGPALKLPGWVTAMTPFHHLSLAPAVPVAWTANAVMAVTGIALAAAGFAAYGRRDLA